MTSFFTITLIGISLSMDAFSLALAYGMAGIEKKKVIAISIIVGLFHLIMPLLGLLLGIVIDSISFINLHIIAAIILIYVGLELIISNLKEEYIPLNKINTIVFSLSVSIDSLTIGIGLKAITNNYILAPLIFSICSSIFTYLGLILGNIIGKKIGIYSKTIGGFILIAIAILMIIK